MFRLCFIIDYKIYNSKRRQIIYSKPFRVKLHPQQQVENHMQNLNEDRVIVGGKDVICYGENGSSPMQPNITTPEITNPDLVLDPFDQKTEPEPPCATSTPTKIYCNDSIRQELDTSFIETPNVSFESTMDLLNDIPQTIDSDILQYSNIASSNKNMEEDDEDDVFFSIEEENKDVTPDLTGQINENELLTEMQIMNQYLMQHDEEVVASGTVKESLDSTKFVRVYWTKIEGSKPVTYSGTNDTQT
jgi:hypothetical protein